MYMCVCVCVCVYVYIERGMQRGVMKQCMCYEIGLVGGVGIEDLTLKSEGCATMERQAELCKW